MGWLDWLRGPSPVPAPIEPREDKSAAIIAGLQAGTVPGSIAARLAASAAGTAPWIATLTPAELSIIRARGLVPVAAVSATCWMQYGRSWTRGHQQGWNTALLRLQREAKAAGAHAVVDVKMRTLPMGGSDSMDFTLVGTAVRLAGTEPSPLPVAATVSALEFVKLLEADVVPVGIAVGADFQYMPDFFGAARRGQWNNAECAELSELRRKARTTAHAELRRDTEAQGNGALAHTNFSQLLKTDEGSMYKFLARHIVIATVVEAKIWRKPFSAIPHEIGMAVDLRTGGTAWANRARHHQSYATRNAKEAI